MAVPIVAVVLGVILLVMVTAEAGVWGWVLFGVAALIGLVIVVWAVGRRHQHPSDLDAPVTRARKPDDGKARVLVISDGSATSQAFHDAVVARTAGRPPRGARRRARAAVEAVGLTGDDQARHDAEEPGANRGRARGGCNRAGRGRPTT